MPRRTLTFVFCLVLSYLMGSTAEAQYTPPGELADRPVDRQETVREAADEARWRLGVVRVEPYLGLRDLGYENSSDDRGSGFTATLGAGLTAFLRNGDRVLWEAHVLPEYIWWPDDSDRNRLGGRYGAGLYGDFNRLSVILAAGREETQGFRTPEYEQRVVTRNDHLEADVNLRLTGAFELFARARDEEIGFEVDDIDDPRARMLDTLDRSERGGRAGVRYRPRSWLSLAVGAERAETEFAQGSLDRSSSGTYPFFEAALEGNRIYALLDVALRDLEPEPGSQLPAYDEPAGRILVSLFPDGRLQPAVYGARTLLYSAVAGYPYYDEERGGISLTYRRSRRLSLRSFAEAGRLDYRPLDGTIADRRDDLLSLGAEVTFDLRFVTLSVEAIRTEYDSNLDVFDREVTAIRTGVRLAGDLSWL